MEHRDAIKIQQVKKRIPLPSILPIFLNNEFDYISTWVGGIFH